MAWLTPDEPGNDTRCRVIHFPDSDEYERLVWGALLELTEDWNWVPHGTETVENVTGQFYDTVSRMLQMEACMPIGAIVSMAADVIPDGFLYCDGSEVNIDDYPGLHAVIGTAWGAASAGKFKLPDLRARTLLGEGTLPNHGAKSVGDFGGADKVALAVSELATHAHGTVAHAHAYLTAVATLLSVGLEPPAPSAVPGAGVTDPATVIVENTGDGDAHENMPPYATVYFVIRYR